MFDIDRIFLFKNLDINQVEDIISNLSAVQNFNPNETIYSDLKFTSAIGFVLKGKAYAITNNGSNVYMNNFEIGSCFGAAAVFGNKEKYVSTVISKTKTKILFISEDELKKIFNKYPQTAINYIEFLSDKIRFLNKKLNVISSSDTEGTLYNYLSTVVDKDGFANIPISMTTLSKMLGISRASLYRSLESLESKKKIIRENNYIKVI